VAKRKGVRNASAGMMSESIDGSSSATCRIMKSKTTKPKRKLTSQPQVGSSEWLDGDPTPRARIACLEWVDLCYTQLGWDESALPDLEKLWWECHDRFGHLKPSNSGDKSPP
jgi:hypothetical protein